MTAPLTLELPEPPSLNEMLDMAKKRWRGRPVVYASQKAAYEMRVLATLNAAHIDAPAEPWPRWTLDRVVFRLHQERDTTELLAGLKWPVDALVRWKYVAGDSPRELLSTPHPEQVVDREHRGVTLTLSPAPRAEAHA